MFKLHPLPRTLSAAERDLDSADSKVRLSALRDLARFPEEARAGELAAEKLQDADAEVRAQAALILADLGARAYVPEVLRLVGDAHLRVRQMALVSLGELASPGDEAVLGRVGAFLTVPEPALRFQALGAWVRIATAGTEEVLAERALDADGKVRTLSLRLIQEHWVDRERALPPRLAQVATERLDDDEPSVRLVAAILLGRAGLDTSVEVLIDAVARRRGVTEPIDEQDAIELCGALGLQDAIPVLRRRAFGLWGRSRDPFGVQAKVALALLGDERARASILAGLSARSWQLRAIAGDSAGRARLHEALPKIEALRADPKIDPELVERALGALTGAPEPRSGRAHGDNVESALK